MKKHLPCSKQFSAGRRILGWVVFGFGLICLTLLIRAQATAEESEGVDGASCYNPAYPRLGLIAIGYDQRYLPAVWPVFAKFNVVIIGGNWETWGDARAYTREDVVRGIKADSTIGTKIFQYTYYCQDLPSGQGFNIGEPTWVAAVDNNNWWLYTTGTSGTRVSVGGNADATNITRFAPRDPATNLRPLEFAADFAYNTYNAGNATHPRDAAPSLDGFFQDGAFWKPRVDGDWNRDGTTDSQDTPMVQFWYRQGEADFPNELRRLSPGQLEICNNADWPQASTTKPGAIAPLNDLYNGGVLEALIGASYSVETWGGFAGAMAWYDYVMKCVAPPQLEFINQENLNADGSDATDTTPYRAMRYGLCLTLMNNGYYTGEGANHHSGALNDIQWYDEYDGGGLGAGYLGHPACDPNGAVQTKARWNYGPMGVWAREFSGGIAILNPKGNGAQTITIYDLGGPGKWKHIQGTQDPVTNNGTAVTTSITLADRDGLILLRQ